jgi:large subunit ribosomal protein L16
MLFTPKISQIKRSQKGKLPSSLKLHWNFYDKSSVSLKLVSNSFGNLTTKHLITIRFLIRKFIKKKGILKFHVFPQKSITSKPSEIRMGKGKGSFSHWSTNIYTGNTICEIFFKKKFKRNIESVLKRVQIRLPISTKIK